MKTTRAAYNEIKAYGKEARYAADVALIKYHSKAGPRVRAILAFLKNGNTVHIEQRNNVDLLIVNNRVREWGTLPRN